MTNYKPPIILGILLLSLFQLSAQNLQESSTLSIAYWGQFAYQPGAKISLSIPHRRWQNNRSQKKVFSNYQVGFYTNPETESGYLAGVELGIQSSPQGKTRFQAISVGAAYLLQSDVIGFSVDLATGETGKKDRKTDHLFLPTINYQFGNQLGERASWYSKVSLGSKLSNQLESEMVVFLELGLQFSLQ